MRNMALHLIDELIVPAGQNVGSKMQRVTNAAPRRVAISTSITALSVEFSEALCQSDISLQKGNLRTFFAAVGVITNIFRNYLDKLFSGVRSRW